MRVLYEDNHLIAVYKPAGVLVQGDITGDPCLMDEVKEYLKKKYHKPGNVFLGLLHRLDRPVSGIVLFARTSKAAARLSEQIRNHKIKKIYQAEVLGKMPKKSGTLINYIKKDEARKVAVVSDKPDKQRQKAELIYTVLKEERNYSLLEIELKTGRFHQIRAQLAHAGHPIKGDVKYGAPKPLSDRAIALCATSLTFKLPTQDKFLTIKDCLYF
jgi:23S rRNA pseudouridine1911/1915/1917 synthase